MRYRPFAISSSVVKSWSRRALFGATLLAIASACSSFTSTGTGADSPDGGTGADGSALGTTSSGDAALDAGDVTPADAAPPPPRWCDGGHAFCADFDDLASTDSPLKGWTEASKDSVGTTAALTQAGVQSAPNAVRIDLAKGKDTFYFLTESAETVDGGAMKTASLTFAMRPKISEGDAGDINYTIGHVTLRNGKGDEIGSATMDWHPDHVVVLVWQGNTGYFGGDPWQPPSGTLTGDKWLIVTIAFDFTKATDQKVSFKLQDETGAKIGSSIVDGRSWAGVRSIDVDVGVVGNDQDRLPLTLLLDNVALDVSN